MPKFENLQFELGEKLGHHTVVKFYGKSNGDSLDALKRCSDPEIGHKGLIGVKISKKFKILARRKVSGKISRRIER